jgi:hypothetical protein
MRSIRLCHAICTAAAAASAAAFSPSIVAPPSPSMQRGNSADCLFSGAIDDFDDFADFSSTQLAPSDDKRGAVAGGDDPFLSSLQSRLKEVHDRSDKLVSGPPPASYLYVQKSRSRTRKQKTRSNAHMIHLQPNGNSHSNARTCAPRSP